jgi:hypothetical protein
VFMPHTMLCEKHGTIRVSNAMSFA